MYGLKVAGTDQNADPHFAFFFQIFNFSFWHSYIKHMDILLSKISQQLLDLGLWNL